MSKLTLEKIAELAGVSRSTASRVLRKQGSVSQRARTNVLRVVEETGFQPNAAARMLAGHRTNIIGIYISEMSRHVFHDSYFSRLIEGVTEAANSFDQTLSLFLLHDDNDIERMATRVLQNQLVDGLVISSTRINNPIIPMLLERELPFVVVGRHDHPSVSFIDGDNVGGAYAAVTHLLRLGYKRIGTITGKMSNYNAVDRLAGYKKAHHVRGLEVHDELAYDGRFVHAGGYDGARYLLEHTVDAIFAASDSMALGALEAIQEAGLRVPEDVALVGFDGLEMTSSTHPPLTTVRQHISSTGNMAVQMLLDQIESRDLPPQRISMPSELVIRASSGVPL